jgi:NAD(P)H-hydrate epimerase
MARLDRESPTPVDVLMERAGWAVAREAATAMGAGYGTRVAVLAGPGNNGGDGYVAARLLSERGAAVEIVTLAEPKTPVAQRAAALARRRGVVMSPWSPPGHEDLVIDALFGGGLRDGLPAEVKPWLETSCPVLSVDVPSGLDPDTGTGDSFQADATVTFHALRPGHVLGDGPDRCGRVVVADIGIQGGDPVMQVAEESDAALPTRPRRAHKWSAGSVLVVGGSPGMEGAAVFAARSALHFGAGAVGLAVPPTSSEVVAGLAPDLLRYSSDYPPTKYDVLVIGPGLDPAEAERLEHVVSGWQGPVVFDAGGISLGASLAASRPGPSVLTPHAGEFSRAFAMEAGPQTAMTAASGSGSTVLLKGSPTLVTGGGVPWVVREGGPELASIGTGDVLAGMVGALLARGLNPVAAATSAAFWHGRAGRLVASTGSLTADRLAVEIGRFAW